MLVSLVPLVEIVATAIQKFSDTRFIIGGYTNTNSGNPYDGYLALIDATGNFAVKRKLASSSKSEKITDLISGMMFISL